MKEISANVTLKIIHHAGPVIEDKIHILNWLVYDATMLEGWAGGFRFDACDAHRDPEECDHNCAAGEITTYHATIMDAAPEDD